MPNRLRVFWDGAELDIVDSTVSTEQMLRPKKDDFMSPSAAFTPLADAFVTVVTGLSIKVRAIPKEGHSVSIEPFPDPYPTLSTMLDSALGKTVLPAMDMMEIERRIAASLAAKAKTFDDELVSTRRKRRAERKGRTVVAATKAFSELSARCSGCTGRPVARSPRSLSTR